MKKHLLYLLIFITVFTLSGCGYNTMQANEETVKAAWGDVEASYQRRNDLIPNLVETVKAYTKHEKKHLPRLQKQGQRSVQYRCQKACLTTLRHLLSFRRRSRQ